MHKKVYKFLIQKEISCECNDEKEEISIHISIDSDEYTLIMRFSKYYPYEFPEMYMYDRVEFVIPHRYTNKQLCLYDSNERLPNPERYLDEALETVERARKLLIDSRARKNEEDFNKEFLAYWDTNSIGGIDFLDDIQKASHIMKGYEWIKDQYIVSDRENQIVEFAKATYKVNPQNVRCKKVLFLNIGQKTLDIARNIGDIQKWIDDRSGWSLFCNFLIQNQKDGVIIICANNGFGECAFAIKVDLLFHNKRISVNSKQIKRVLVLYKHHKFHKLRVKNFGMKRLFTRGGEGTANFDEKCLVVGCGAVGGYLSKGIVDVGVTDNITLVDNDMLSDENLGRHLCGSNFLFEKKAGALRNQLLRHYPTLECQAIDKNILEYLLTDNMFFDQFDTIFVAVGNTLIEKKIFQMLKEKSITANCIILWVEPYLIAGHALIFKGDINEATEQNIFDENGRFNNSVLINGNQYLKSEAGCQSAYAPYAGYEVQKFILDFIDVYYQKIYNKTDCANYSFTWIGKMKWARKQSIQVKPEWRAKDDRYIELKRIDAANGI